jgi:hypothetical protein
MTLSSGKPSWSVKFKDFIEHHKPVSPPSTPLANRGSSAMVKQSSSSKGKGKGRAVQSDDDGINFGDPDNVQYKCAIFSILSILR